MAQVIKSNSKFISVPGAFAADKLKPNPSVTELSGTSAKPLLKRGANKFPLNEAENEKQTEEETEQVPDEPTEEEKALSAIAAERDRIITESVEAAKRTEEAARLKAIQIEADADKKAEALLADTRAECERIKAEAVEQGFAEGSETGYADGEKKGYEAGYDKGLLKCRDTLKELIALLKETTTIKEQIYMEHEHELFDAVFTIANKVTADSLKQKDKAVLRNILKETAKRYRHSEFIKVTLSKLDIEEMGNAEVDALKNVFRESQHIEFEIIKDAPAGTLILDNGSEITDAGVSTQLKMIENLGKGKFRDKPDE